MGFRCASSPISRSQSLIQPATPPLAPDSLAPPPRCSARSSVSAHAPCTDSTALSSRRAVPHDILHFCARVLASGILRRWRGVANKQTPSSGACFPHLHGCGWWLGLANLFPNMTTATTSSDWAGQLSWKSVLRSGAHTPHQLVRFIPRRDCRAAFRATSSCWGMSWPVPKYISSGV